MAIEGYQQIDPGNCIDQNYFPLANDSLFALENAAKEGGGVVECIHLTGAESGDTESGEICLQLVAPNDMPDQLQLGEQICCIFLSVHGSMENPVLFEGGEIIGGLRLPTTAFYFPYAGIETTIRCTGQTLSTDEGRGSGIISLLLDPTACDFSNGLEICFEPNFQGSITSGEPLEWNINYCGCMLCVQCPPLPLNNYYMPPFNNPFCDYGIGDFAMIINAVNELSAAFRCAGYTVECVTREGLPDRATIAGPFERETKWVGVTCTTATWAFTPQGSYIRVNTEMGCETRMIGCNSSAYLTRTGTISAGAAEFVSVACGECLPGESLYFNANPEIACGTSQIEEDQPVAGVTPITQNTDGLFFVFTKLENDLPAIPQISSQCVFQDNVDAIKEAADAIHVAACEIKKPQKSTHQYFHSGQNGEHTVIVPASPPPPEPAEKKWLILGSLQAEIFIPDVLAYDDTVTIAPEFWYQIKCGGAPVHTSPKYVWPAMILRTTFPRSFRVPVCAFVTCDVTLDIEICTFITAPNWSGIGRGVSDGLAICIN